MEGIEAEEGLEVGAVVVADAVMAGFRHRLGGYGLAHLGFPAVSAADIALAVFGGALWRFGSEVPLLRVC